MAKNKKGGKKPLTRAQVARRTDQAFKCAILIMMWVVIETGRFTKDEIKELWNAINYKAESVTNGYCKLKDISRMLLEEYGIEIEVV